MSFSPSPDVWQKMEDILLRLPPGRRNAAALEILDLIQAENGGWISGEVFSVVGDKLEIPPVALRDMAAFYSRFNLEPPGRHVVCVCMGRSCLVRGGGAVMDACRSNLGIEPGEMTEDGFVTLREAKCLGSCGQAPVVSLDGENLGHASSSGMREIFRKWRAEEEG